MTFCANIETEKYHLRLFLNVNEFNYIFTELLLIYISRLLPKKVANFSKIAKKIKEKSFLWHFYSVILGNITIFYYFCKKKLMFIGERFESISLMRVMAMTMIVLFHSFLFYTGTWWVFGGIVVPVWVKVAKFLDSIDLSMFVFISGFLYGYLYLYKGKYRDIRTFLSSKVRRLLIPYLFWGFFVVILPPSPFDWKILFVGSAHLWFLLMLFWLFCFSIIAVKFLGKIDAKTFCLFFFLLYFVWLIHYKFSSHHSFLCLESALSNSLIFIIGMVCAKMQIWLKPLKPSIVISLMSIMALFIYIFFVPTFEDIIDNLVLRILSYTFIVNLFIVLTKLHLSSVWNVFVNSIDKMSMGIYIFNQFVVNALLLVPEINYWLVHNYIIGPLVIFVISFFIPLCLSYLFNINRNLSWTIGG